MAANMFSASKFVARKQRVALVGVGALAGLALGLLLGGRATFREGVVAADADRALTAPSMSPLDREEEFRALALGLKPTTDKVTKHGYETMYAYFLGPMRNELVKMLEIGLGCNMVYGAGASLKLWTNYLPHAQIWFAEYDEKCVEKSKGKGLLRDVNIVTGDQGIEKTVRRWAKETGGSFNVIIDDGGHFNKQITTSFYVLWDSLLPGGYYFIEDLEAGRSKSFEDSGGQGIVADIIYAWIDQLLITPGERASLVTSKDERTDSMIRQVETHPLPKKVKFIMCQQHACVIAKCGDKETTEACRGK
jgi:hypothetical protein